MHWLLWLRSFGYLLRTNSNLCFDILLVINLDLNRATSLRHRVVEVLESKEFILVLGI